MSLVIGRRLLSSVNSVSNLLQIQSPKEDVFVRGWVKAIQRKHPSFYFLKINDGLGVEKLQAIVPANVLTGGQPNLGAAVSIHGNWVKSKGKQQDMELLATACSVCGRYETPQVQGPNGVTRNIPHLRAKMPSFAAMFRLRSRLNHLTHNFFMVGLIVKSSATSNDCEGAGEVFTVKSSKHTDFFNTNSDVFLPVSTQLHLEAMTGAIPNVYTITPVFRADNSDRPLRLAEFRMLEVECAFVNSVTELMDLLDEYLKFVVREMAKFKCDIEASEEVCDRSKLNLLDGLKLHQPIPRIKFSEAVSILESKSQTCGDSFDKKQELELVQEIGGPLFVTHLPSKYKPFYMKRTDDGKFVENFELLAPVVGELAGGSVREDSCELLLERLRYESRFEWYLEIRRSGYPKSSGFGLGFDRLMQSIFGVQNIKETIPFPRWYKGMNC